MKFKCGLTWEEEIAKSEAHEKSLSDVVVWHRWYAWFPVKVAEGDCRWLEVVERRRVVYRLDPTYLADYGWKYRNVNEAQ